VPTPEQVRTAVERYVDTFQRQDRAAWLDLFAPDAVHYDPVGTPPNEGREGIAAFWDRTFAMLEKGRFDVHQVFVCGDQAAMTFTFTGTAGGGGITFEGAETFLVGEDGRIREFRAYWDTMRPLAPQSD
jgi:steroid delta-isomerase